MSNVEPVFEVLVQRERRRKRRCSDRALIRCDVSDDSRRGRRALSVGHRDFESEYACQTAIHIHTHIHIHTYRHTGPLHLRHTSNQPLFGCSEYREAFHTHTHQRRCLIFPILISVVPSDLDVHLIQCSRGQGLDQLFWRSGWGHKEEKKKADRPGRPDGPSRP